MTDPLNAALVQHAKAVSSCALPEAYASGPKLGAEGKRPQLYTARSSCEQSWVQVMDALVVSLAKWTVLLDPQAPKPSVAFGDNAKACLATEAIFALANR